MKGARAVVVGAGVSGLVAAGLLARRGYDVVVYEKNDRPGGRAAQEAWDGYTFDSGPTLLFMLDVFRDAFARLGRDFDADVPTVRLRPNYRLNFVDGSSLTVSTVLAETLESLEALQAGASAGFLHYLAGAAHAYETSLREFVTADAGSWSAYLQPRRIAALLRAGAFRSLRRSAVRAFGSEGIASALGFQSMYLGMSPFDSPDLYRLLVFAELGGGVFFPRGGIGGLIRALEAAARGNGARFVYDAEVTAVERRDGSAAGVRVGSERIPADVVLLTAEVPYAYAALLGEPRHRSVRMRETPSALVLYVGLGSRYDDLLHHEFLLPDNLGATCRDIFTDRRFPRDPAIYLCAPARTDPSFAPADGEALYVLVPAPNLRRRMEEDDAEHADEILQRIERRRLPGLRSRVRFCRTRSARDFARHLNLPNGAAFGLAHDVRQIGPLRPDNRHRRYRNVYFAGASTRPATGLPLVTLSAMQTVDRIVRDHRRA